MIVVEHLAAFYGFVAVYAVLHLAGQWIANRLDAWQHRRLTL